MSDPGLAVAIEALLEPATNGDPESPLRWTLKSTRQLAEALSASGHPTSSRTVAHVLEEDLGYGGSMVKKLRMPVWLTPIAPAFVYVLTLYAGYKQAFKRIDWKAAGRSTWRQKPALL